MKYENLLNVFPINTRLRMGISSDEVRSKLKGHYFAKLANCAPYSL